ncbi:hypothetical protein FOL47_004886 [Perkinsus chesapeaki]|uniref:Large ribosomal subunit protein bL12 C-terminal domain-containing protein n=1 Tax=Perkinsus chesapeaki TaxID=330153 RepID=A0A7J6M058_PERCH|nr:hypothetical protein FOL47_004886 [Perkinsus chesapeaki]
MFLSSTRLCAAESAHLIDAKPQVRALASRIANLAPKEQMQLSEMCHERLVARPLGAGKSWKPPAAPSLPGMLPFPHPAMLFTNQVPQVGVLPQELPSVSQAVQGFHFEELFKMLAGSAPVGAACPPVLETNQPSASDESTETPAEEDATVEKQQESSTQAKMVKALKLVAFPEKNKLKVIKEIRQLLGLGLKEAKEASENLPKVLAKQVPREEADTIAAKFVELGGEVAME